MVLQLFTVGVSLLYLYRVIIVVFEINLVYFTSPRKGFSKPRTNIETPGRGRQR